LRIKPQPMFNMQRTPSRRAIQMFKLMEIEAAVRIRIEEQANQSDRPLPINISLPF
jgi:hypothetical protein